jgi:predicted dehydrogenase
MSEPLKIGVIGLIHDHVWDNLPWLSKSPDGKLVAVADCNAPLVERAIKEYGCKGYSDPAEMLDTEELNAVYIFSSNAEGAVWATDAASRGLHVLIEKPMAATLEEADLMLAVARQNNTRMMINWPFAWWPQLQHALVLAKQGAIGDLWQVKYRAAHEGPKELGCSDYFCDWLFDSELNGAGALMDYCCYGALLARVLLGMPSRVSGVKGRFLKEAITVEDNAILVMTYPSGMATAEGSWTQIGKLTSYSTAIYGAQGVLFVEPRLGGKLLLATAENPEGSEVEVPELKLDQQNSAQHFLSAVRNSQEFNILCQDRICRDTQEILEAGLISSTCGSEISLPLAIGQ